MDTINPSARFPLCSTGPASGCAGVYDDTSAPDDYHIVELDEYQIMEP